MNKLLKVFVFFISSSLFFIFGFFLHTLLPTSSTEDNFKLSITEIGSDYVNIEYNLPIQIELNQKTIDLPKENHYTIHDLFPSTYYNIVYRNFDLSFETKMPSNASDVLNIDYYYQSNLFFTWVEPFTFGGQKKYYLIELNNNIFISNDTIFEIFINSTISFRIKANTGNWSHNYVCLYDPQYVIPAFCSIESEKYPLTYSVTSTSITLMSKFLNVLFQNKTYNENSVLRLDNLIPDTVYNLTVNLEQIDIKTEQSFPCGNKNDIDFIQYQNLLNKLQTYTKSCIFSTIDTCVQNDLIRDGLSSSCALCFGQNSKCAVSNCSTKCIINSKSNECINCSVDNCSSSLAVCANIPTTILPDPRISI